MTENKYLRWAFWVLCYGMGPVLLIGLWTCLKYEGPVRIPAMIFIAILSLVWIWISDMGKEALREMA